MSPTWALKGGGHTSHALRESGSLTKYCHDRYGLHSLNFLEQDTRMLPGTMSKPAGKGSVVLQLHPLKPLFQTPLQADRNTAAYDARTVRGSHDPLLSAEAVESNPGPKKRRRRSPPAPLDRPKPGGRRARNQNGRPRESSPTPGAARGLCRVTPATPRLAETRHTQVPSSPHHPPGSARHRRFLRRPPPFTAPRAGARSSSSHCPSVSAQRTPPAPRLGPTWSSALSTSQWARSISKRAHSCWM